MASLVSKGMRIEHEHVPGKKPELQFFDSNNQLADTVQIGQWKEDDIEAFLSEKLVVS